MGINDLFDKYSLRARYLPAVLVVAPPLMAASLLFPKVYERVSASATALGVSLSLSLVLLYFMASVLRARGRTVEKRLIAKNGGLPTTCWLRHRDGNLDAATKARYRTFLSTRVPNLNLPSESQERHRPDFADQSYRSAVKWLLEATRDTAKYPLVLEENVHYGFRRNMLGGKWIAVALVTLPGIVAVGIALWRGVPSALLDADHAAAAAVTVLTGAAWLLFVTQAWVEDASNAYARALLACCEA